MSHGSLATARERLRILRGPLTAAFTAVGHIRALAARAGGGAAHAPPTISREPKYNTIKYTIHGYSQCLCARSQSVTSERWLRVLEVALPDVAAFLQERRACGYTIVGEMCELDRETYDKTVLVVAALMRWAKALLRPSRSNVRAATPLQVRCCVCACAGACPRAVRVPAIPPAALLACGTSTCGRGRTVFQCQG